MGFAIFDLDNTLIGGDSDHLWGEFVCEEGIVDADGFSAENDRFYADYQAGQLDIQAYLRFALAPLRGRSPETLAAWHARFMARKIEPIMLPRARDLIEQHRQRGDTLLVITATNRFITEPIAAALGIADIIACEPEIRNGYYTGEPTGVPAYREGKVQRLQQWLEGRTVSMAGACFYSDSHNDLPLLQQVDRPVAVDPDPTLLAHARAAGWPVISLRDP